MRETTSTASSTGRLRRAAHRSVRSNAHQLYRAQGKLRGKRGSDNGSSQPGATARPRALRLPASRAGNAARLNPEGVQLAASFALVVS